MTRLKESVYVMEEILSSPFQLIYKYLYFLARIEDFNNIIHSQMKLYTQLCRTDCRRMNKNIQLGRLELNYMRLGANMLDVFPW